jgi:regulator of RNase E activity RraA
MVIKGLTPSELDLLRRYDTPTVCNVIELFDIRPRTAGFMDHRIKACFPEMPSMVGYAATATFRAAFPPAGPDMYTMLPRQLDTFKELPGPVVVVFQDLDDPPVGATFGEVMVSLYRAHGSVGLVTSGTGRDLEQIRPLGYPLFTVGATCSHGYCHIPSLNETIRVGGLTVRPGDLMHGDANGVTNIPNEIASEVAGACAEFAAAEAVTLDYLRAGQVTQKGLEAARAEQREMTAALRKRLSRKV